MLLVIGAGTLVTLLILGILYVKTLAPLWRTIAGIRQVADGDFGRRIPVVGTSEVRRLTESVNGLSGRLDVLFKLIERLQRGNDLDEVIGFLSREFPTLLRIDWIGVVFVSTDGDSAYLEVSYLDGERERASKRLFRLQGTLLEQALARGTPFHIPDMDETAKANPHYEFLRTLVERGQQDAIMLPLTPQTLTPIPAVVVFATRTPGTYDDAHLQFLDNIALLITHSFGRTVRLAEHGRLAAIGEFASGIAHELRTPLTTLSLALDFFERIDLEEKAAKRLTLARQESARMQRLLEDILLYAKPMKLDLRPLPVAALLQRFVEDHRELPASRRQSILVKGMQSDARIMADKDRIVQILVNLTQNACEAASEGAQIRWTIRDENNGGSVSLEITNPGKPIPPDVLSRLTEPFFSTKASGTGLGLAIVRRLAVIHGAELSFSSDENETCASLVFPRLATTAVTETSAEETAPTRRIPESGGESAMTKPATPS
jgi:signal transduction histidine kinase